MSMNDYLPLLCHEYLDLIAAMQSPDHDADARRALSAERTWTHCELIRLTGNERPFDMEQFARTYVATH